MKTMRSDLGGRRSGLRTRWRLPVLFLGAGLVAACGGGHDDHAVRFPAGASEPPTADVMLEEMVLEKPAPLLRHTLDGEELECTECHEDQDPSEFARRELTLDHTDIVLKHDERNRWCLDCHDAENRNMFRLANGRLVPPEESFRLCGQCHGDKFRDWRAGVHGRRTGQWNGKKTYLVCVHCHNPHQPQFQPIPPMPVPVRPEDLGSQEDSQ
jgi:hypothetical protein